MAGLLNLSTALPRVSMRLISKIACVARDLTAVESASRQAMPNASGVLAETRRDRFVWTLLIRRTRPSSTRSTRIVTGERAAISMITAALQRARRLMTPGPAVISGKTLVISC
jgi:hypothetical protein